MKEIDNSSPIDYSFYNEINNKEANCKGNIVQWVFKEVDGIISPNPIPDDCLGCKYTIKCMQHQSKNIVDNEFKLEYAKQVLSKDQFNIIGIEWILSNGMTIEKLDVIGCHSVPGDIGNNYLNLDQIKALSGKCLANPRMTFIKIILMSQFFDADNITKIGAENLTNMSIDELNSIAFM